MSFGRTQQLQDLKEIIEEISQEIMWVNDREEEELVFDWGDKNIDQYIPQKQESYSVSQTIKDSVRTRRAFFCILGAIMIDFGSNFTCSHTFTPALWLLNLLSVEQKLMSALEVKENQLNKLKAKVDTYLKNNHPASDKIEVRNPAFVTSTSEEIINSPK